MLDSISNHRNYQTLLLRFVFPFPGCSDVLKKKTFLISEKIYQISIKVNQRKFTLATLKPCTTPINPTTPTNKPKNCNKMQKWSPLPASIFVSNNYPKTTIYRQKQVSSGQYGEYTNPKGEYYGCNCVACFPILPNEMVMPQLPLSRDKGQIQSEPKPKRQY